MTRTLHFRNSFRNQTHNKMAECCSLSQRGQANVNTYRNNVEGDEGTHSLERPEKGKRMFLLKSETKKWNFWVKVKCGQSQARKNSRFRRKIMGNCSPSTQCGSFCSLRQKLCKFIHEDIHRKTRNVVFGIERISPQVPYIIGSGFGELKKQQ